MRWISYALLAGGLATISAGLYVVSSDGGSDGSVHASQAATPTATATALAVLPPASSIEPEMSVVPEAAMEIPPEVLEEPPPPAPEPQQAPTQAPAPPAPVATATPRPPAPAAPPPPPPVPTSTPVPPPPPPPAAPVAPAVSLGGLEQAMFAAHNAERAGSGLGGLVLDGALTQIARLRAQDMASKNYFAHTSPTGQTAFTLLNGSGYVYTLAGENLARNNYPDGQSVSVAMNGFMTSQAHRVNVLEPKFSRVGIGMALGADGMKYFAVVFAAK